MEAAGHRLAAFQTGIRLGGGDTGHVAVVPGTAAQCWASCGGEGQAPRHRCGPHLGRGYQRGKS
jgi:hypothetical protein